MKLLKQHALMMYLQIAYWKPSSMETDPLSMGLEKKMKLFEPVVTYKVSYFLGWLIDCQ